MKAIILAAGEGKRLRPYTNDKPKCMVDVCGSSLIERQLSVLKSEGIDDIVIVGGYKSHMLHPYSDKILENVSYSDTNMVWTLFCAVEQLQGDILICYGDIVYSRNILKSLLNSTSDIATTVDMEWESYWKARNENILSDAETLRLDDNGCILEIGRRPMTVDEIEGQYMGLIKLNNKGTSVFKSVFHGALECGLMGETVRDAYMTDLLQEVINSGSCVQSVPVRGEWVEVDTVSDLNAKITCNRLREIDLSLNQ